MEQPRGTKILGRTRHLPNHQFQIFDRIFQSGDGGGKSLALSHRCGQAKLVTVSKPSRRARQRADPARADDRYWDLTDFARRRLCRESRHRAADYCPKRRKVAAVRTDEPTNSPIPSALQIQLQ